MIHRRWCICVLDSGRPSALVWFRPPMAIGPVLTFLATPIRHLGECVGAFYVGEKEVGRGFRLLPEYVA